MCVPESALFFYELELEKQYIENFEENQKNNNDDTKEENERD